MKTLLASILGLTAMASVALAGEAVTGTTARSGQLMQLSAAQMDQVTAGAADASFSFSGSASGPNNASVNGELTQTTTVVGGSAPSNAAAQMGTFSAHAD
jgi:hypothetical protein